MSSVSMREKKNLTCLKYVSSSAVWAEGISVMEVQTVFNKAELLGLLCQRISSCRARGAVIVQILVMLLHYFGREKKESRVGQISLHLSVCLHPHKQESDMGVCNQRYIVSGCL